MRNKIQVLFLCTVLFSCSKKSSIKEILVAQSNENWVYSSACANNFAHYKFDESNDDKLNNIAFYKNKDKGDKVEVTKKRSLSRGKGFRVHRLVYAVIDYDEEMLVLHCKRKLNTNGNVNILIKKKANYHLQKSSGFYLERRINHPE